MKKDFIDNILATLPTKGKKDMEPFKSFCKERGIPMNIVEDHEVTNNIVEQHMGMADLWLCVEGEGTFTYGGEMVGAYPKKLPDGSLDEREWRAPSISGGETVVLRAGDWLWVPAGEPHVHGAEKTSRFVVVKIPDNS